MNGSWLDRNRHLIFVTILLIAVIGVIVVYLWQPAQEPIEILSVEPTATALPTATPAPTPIPTPGVVRVYLTGAVVNSDVYVLPHNSIIKDAVEAAGGFAPNAERERINLALELKDQQQIHVPRQGEENPPPPVQDAPDTPDVPDNDSDTGDGNPAPATGGLININTATLDQLDILPGIGPAIAQRIIDYREDNGEFKNIEEITQVSGIGEATFAKIKDSITVQ